MSIDSPHSLIPSDDPSGRILAPQPTPQSGEQASTIGPMSILHAVRRRWKLALPLGLLMGGMLGAAGWFLLKPKFTAVASLRVAADAPTLLDESSNARNDYKLYRNTQMAMMKNPLILSAALRPEAVNTLPVLQDVEDPIAFLAKEVTVKFDGDSEVMLVSFTSTDSNSAVAIVNAIVDAYREEVVDRELIMKNARLKEIDQAYNEKSDFIKQQKGTMKKLADSLGTGDSESLKFAQQSTVQLYGQMLGRLSEIRFELLQARSKLEMAEKLTAQYAKTQEENAGEAAGQEQTDLDAMVESYIDRSPEILKLRDEIDARKGQLLVLAETYGDGFPTVKEAKKELKYRESLMAERRESLRETAKEAVKKEQASIAQQRQRLESESLARDMQMQNSKSLDLFSLETLVGSLDQQEKAVAADVEKLDAERRTLGNSSMVVDMLESEINVQQAFLDDLARKKARLEIERDAAPRIELLSRADNASKPDLMKQITRTAALALFGLMAPLALLVGWDLTHRRVDSTNVVSNVLSMPTLGTIPMVPQRILFRDPPDGDRLMPERIRLVEAVDSIGSMVQFLARSEEGKVYIITSAVPSEGKSTVSCQLADSLARSGMRVLLIDLDLRRPSVHRYLKLSNEFGVAELVEGEVSMADALQTYGTSGNLKVLTAGTERQSMQAMCNNGAIERLLEVVRNEYDIVLLDTCPVLPVADTRSLIKYSDGVFLTLVRDLSRLPLVSDACGILKSYRAKLMGGIIIGVNAIGYAKHYYPQSRGAKAIESKKDSSADPVAT